MIWMAAIALAVLGANGVTVPASAWIVYGGWWLTEIVRAWALGGEEEEE